MPRMNSGAAGLPKTTSNQAELPCGLAWQVEPESWHIADDIVRVRAAGNTDIFVDPNRSAVLLSGARALATAPDEPWQLAAHVTADLRQTYDAAALMLWSDDRHFAKLCLERSPQGRATVVSVVTRDVSDDANAWVVPGGNVWLRISKVATDAYAFHSSSDGKYWDLVRYFALSGDGPIQYGIEAQSPMGDGCTVSFSGLARTSTHLADIRDGS